MERTVEEIVAQIFLHLIRGYKRIESKKFKLVKNPEFSPFSVFLHFDRTGMGYIAFTDVYEYLLQLGVFIKREEAYVILGNFGVNSKGFLNYNEFFRVIVPDNIPEVASLLAKKEGRFTSEVSADFVLLLEAELFLYRELEIYRRKLKAFTTFSSISVYSMLNNGKEIEKNSLLRFLQSFFPVSHSDMDAIFGRLCKHPSGRLRFKEISSLLDLPKSDPTSIAFFTRSPSSRLTTKRVLNDLIEKMYNRQKLRNSERSGSRSSYSPTRPPSSCNPYFPIDMMSTLSSVTNANSTISNTYSDSERFHSRPASTCIAAKSFHTKTQSYEINPIIKAVAFEDAIKLQPHKHPSKALHKYKLTY